MRRGLPPVAEGTFIAAYDRGQSTTAADDRGQSTTAAYERGQSTVWDGR
jgi:hypothetical protein